jgi:hypothetical protein
MRNLLYLLAGIVIICSCTNRTINGNGIVTKQTRELKPFHTVKVSGAFDVYLRSTDKQAFTIETDSNLHSVIKTEVIDSVLIIENTKTILTSDELKLIIGCPDLKSVNFSGATDISGDTALIYKSLNLSISGAGKINLDLQTELINANVSGGANIMFSGKTNNLEVSISGAGKVSADKLVSKNAKIEISGIGEAQLNVTDQLNAIISGLGKVEYIGDPKVNQSISGGGKVVKKEGSNF